MAEELIHQLAQIVGPAGWIGMYVAECPENAIRTQALVGRFDQRFHVVPIEEDQWQTGDDCLVQGMCLTLEIAQDEIGLGDIALFDF